ncbi:Os08g0189000 [Oryza sativa Japonica Group]|nr:hypothetical protein OsJ_26292 [Oryza sativa Japonica Group]BAT04148.1 Os08g0189000 [Oryza sativa Japonica Group]
MWPGRGTVCDQEGSWCTATCRSPRCGCQVVEGRGLEARCPAVIVAVTIIVVVADAARSTSFTTVEDPSSRRPDPTLSSRRLAAKRRRPHAAIEERRRPRPAAAERRRPCVAGGRPGKKERKRGADMRRTADAVGTGPP